MTIQRRSAESDNPTWAWGHRRIGNTYCPRPACTRCYWSLGDAACLHSAHLHHLLFLSTHACLQFHWNHCVTCTFCLPSFLPSLLCVFSPGMCFFFFCLVGSHCHTAVFIPGCFSFTVTAQCFVVQTAEHRMVNSDFCRITAAASWMPAVLHSCFSIKARHAANTQRRDWQ